MRVIIAGDRRAGHIPKKPKPTPQQLIIYEDARDFFINRILDLRMVWKDKYEPITEVVSGMAAGIDTLACDLAKRLTGRKAKEFPANWMIDKKAAGPIRNQKLAEYADGAIIIALEDPGGKSSIGSFDMAKRMRTRGQPYILEMWNLNELDLYVPGIAELYHREA